MTRRCITDAPLTHPEYRKILPIFWRRRGMPLTGAPAGPKLCATAALCSCGPDATYCHTVGRETISSFRSRLESFKLNQSWRDSIGDCFVVKLEAKALIQRGRARLESQQAKILELLRDIDREQQRLQHEAQELDLAEQVVNRLMHELEAEVKVVSCGLPVVRRKLSDFESDMVVARLELA